MKITMLQIDNFRNHTHSILELAGFNVIRGGNFQGKSSVAQAISMCTTPTTTGLDATGRGFATKIKRGARLAVLTADIEGKVHTVRRTVTLNTNTTGRTDAVICLDDPEWHPSPFEKQLDNNRAALAVCMNTDKFFTWDEKEQKSLLAKLALPSQYEFPEDTINAVNKALGDGVIDFDGAPFAVIEKAYKLLYKEREAVNRTVKEFVVPDALSASGDDAMNLQSLLQNARDRQKKLIAERDAATADGNASNVKRTQWQGKVNALKEKINDENNRIEALAGLLSEEKLKTLTKLAEGKDTYDSFEKERAQLAIKIPIKKGRVEAYAKIAGASGEECPTCHQTIDGKTITRLHEETAAELKELIERDGEILRQMRALGDVTGATKAIEAHKSHVKTKVEIETVITEKTKLLQEATAELNKIPTDTHALIPFVKPLDEVDEEITDLVAKLQPAAAAAERAKEIEAKTAQLAKLKDKAYKIDLLVKYFDKDGIKSVMLAEHVGGFVERMNVVMAAFGYSVTLEIEPDFLFIATDTNDVQTPVKELSGSEQLMWLLALQCAVSKAANIGIVVADRLDTFLPAQRSKANQVLYKLVNDGTLEQVIAIMSDTSETVPDLPNSAFFLIEAGKARRL